MIKMLTYETDSILLIQVYKPRQPKHKMFNVWYK